MKKIFIITLLFVIIDILIVGSWILYLDPDPSVGLYLIYLLPVVFLINLIMALTAYFIKKYYAPFFIANSLMSVFLMYFLFEWISERNIRKVLEGWEFSVKGVDYEIAKDRQDSSYRIMFSHENGFQGSENERGITCVKNDTIYFLAVDSSRFYIYDNYIYNFKNLDKIKVKKKY